MAPQDRRALGKAGLLPEEAEAAHAARSEKELQDQILSMLTRQGIHGFRARMDRKSTILKGAPDIWFSLDGKACAFEAKMPGQKPRPDQVAVMERMRRDGWRVAVVHTYAEAWEIFNQWKNES
jgi:hypothetical protein